MPCTIEELRNVKGVPLSNVNLGTLLSDHNSSQAILQVNGALLGVEKEWAGYVDVLRTHPHQWHDIIEVKNASQDRLYKLRDSGIITMSEPLYSHHTITPPVTHTDRTPRTEVIMDQTYIRGPAYQDTTVVGVRANRFISRFKERFVPVRDFSQGAP